MQSDDLTERSELEGLPPPECYRYWSVGHSSRWVYAKAGSQPPNAEPLFTAAQLQALKAGGRARARVVRPCQRHEGLTFTFTSVAVPAAFYCPGCEQEEAAAALKPNDPDHQTQPRGET